MTGGIWWRVRKRPPLGPEPVRRMEAVWVGGMKVVMAVTVVVVVVPVSRVVRTVEGVVVVMVSVFTEVMVEREVGGMAVLTVAWMVEVEVGAGTVTVSELATADMQAQADE